ncbi:MAG: hypothetical protein AABZ08_05170 [Planctomycetota bacterium]
MNDHPRVDRTVFQLGTLGDRDDSVQYWRQRPPEERFEALETLRQIMYGYDPTTERVQKVLEFARLDTDANQV